MIHSYRYTLLTRGASRCNFWVSLLSYYLNLFLQRTPPSILVLISTHIILLQVELEKLRLLCERVIKREKVKVCIDGNFCAYMMLKVEI
jgi:hypothetical protein